MKTTNPGRPLSSRRQQWAAVAVLGAAVLIAGLLLQWPAPAQTPVTQAPLAQAPLGQAPAASDAGLVVLDWPDDIPRAVLDQFAQEHGITIQLVEYHSAEEADRVLEAMPAYDLAVIEHRYIRDLAGAGKLYPIDARHLPNFRFVDPGFRNLSFDPTNRYSAPYSWGATGIIARSGFLTDTHPSWGTLWEDHFANGKLAVWRGGSRHAIAAVLKRLGYSANSEDPVELAAARVALLALRPNVRLFDSWNYQEYVMPAVLGQIDGTIGNTEDYIAALDLKLPISFYYPAEGALVWGDSFVVPTNSRNPALAAELINTLLEPLVAAQIMEQKHMRVANEAALQYVSPALRADAVLFPDLETLRQGELILPLSATGQAAWEAVWADFLAEPD